jgi:metalloendopeptidase OMA1, mitochondrial
MAVPMETSRIPMKKYLIRFAAGAVLILAGCYTNPVTGRKSLMLLSQEQELSLGAQSFTDVQKAETVSSDPAMNERVRRVGQRIAEAVGSELPNAKWEFVVFDSPQVNAFALPGGKVGVYSGLLHLATTDDELAIVMGHEIGHVIARHGAERMSEAMVMSGASEFGAAALQTKVTDPKTVQLFQAAYGGLTTLGRTLPHSRAQESEADRMGAVFAARAGYDPRAAITFWQKMVAQKNAGATSGRIAALLSNHPADEQRISDLHALMPQVVPIYEQNRGKH